MGLPCDIPSQRAHGTRDGGTILRAQRAGRNQHAGQSPCLKGKENGPFRRWVFENPRLGTEGVPDGPPLASHTAAPGYRPL